jgi:hypothetical protein
VSVRYYPNRVDPFVPHRLPGGGEIALTPKGETVEYFHASDLLADLSRLSFKRLIARAQSEEVALHRWELRQRRDEARGEFWGNAFSAIEIFGDKHAWTLRILRRWSAARGVDRRELRKLLEPKPTRRKR